MIQNRPAYIIVHHTGGTDADPLADTSNHTFEIVNDYHKSLWGDEVKSSLGFYMGYHYFIDKQGRLFQARGDFEGGAHTIGMNYSSIGICLAGNFDLTIPTLEQINALRNIESVLQGRYSIPSSKIVPHRTFAKKTCFGKKLKDTWAAEIIKTDLIPDIGSWWIVEKLVVLKIITQQKYALAFGSSFQSGPLNRFDSCL